jgi:hypothetical protein
MRGNSNVLFGMLSMIFPSNPIATPTTCTAAAAPSISELTELPEPLKLLGVPPPQLDKSTPVMRPLTIVPGPTHATVSGVDIIQMASKIVTMAIVRVGRCRNMVATFLQPFCNIVKHQYSTAWNLVTSLVTAGA